VATNTAGAIVGCGDAAGRVRFPPKIAPQKPKMNTATMITALLPRQPRAQSRPMNDARLRSSCIGHSVNGVAGANPNYSDKRLHAPLERMPGGRESAFAPARCAEIHEKWSGRRDSGPIAPCDPKPL